MLPYFGGKGKKELGGWLFKNFDLSGINNYVEPFSGMFGIYLGDFSDFSSVENIIYNDIDKQNCNIFLCAKHPFEFLYAIKSAFDKGGLFYCKGQSYDITYEKYRAIYMQYHDENKKLPEINLSERDFQTALIYSYLRLSSFNRFHFLETEFRISHIDTTRHKRFKILQPLWNSLSNHGKIEKVSRIKEITADDFEDVMKRYNTPDSFIYCDPPYWDREKFYDAEDKGVFKKEDHERLARLINESKARIALSYYDFDELHNFYPENKFTWKSVDVHNNAANKMSTEVLIMNY